MHHNRTRRCAILGCFWPSVLEFFFNCVQSMGSNLARGHWQYRVNDTDLGRHRNLRGSHCKTARMGHPRTGTRWPAPPLGRARRLAASAFVPGASSFWGRKISCGLNICSPLTAERVRELKVDEEARLFENLRLDFHPMVKFALATGIRLANLVNLSWTQIDFTSGQITLKEKSKLPGGRLHTVPIFSGRSGTVGERRRQSSNPRVHLYLREKPG